MNFTEEFFSINKQTWNDRADVHFSSHFHDSSVFQHEETSLNTVELQLLGDISGKDVLHLQCHFGQDSISLSKLGANVTGVDFSERAIELATELAAKTSAKVQFISCNLYEVPDVISKKFDIVFSSYGVISWLPDLDKWAKVISDSLKPNGTFIFVEFHPVIWMFDDHFDKIQYNYFNEGEIVEIDTATTNDRNELKTLEFVNWNHSLSEILTSLLNNGLELTSFQEYNYSSYNCFQNAVEIAPNQFQIKHLGNKIPMMFSLSATKK